MKENLKIVIAVVGAVILAGAFPFLIWKLTSHTGADGTGGNGPGRYLAKKQLAFAGCTMPEATLQSIAWAAINGECDKAFACFSPEMQADINNKPGGRRKFDADIRRNGQQIQGLQITARKMLADDKAELKIKLVIIPPPVDNKPVSDYFVQPLVKIGVEWKLSGSTRKYTPDWDEGSQSEPAAS
jgi:hypothetical protein